MVYNLKFLCKKGGLICCNPSVINSGAVQIADAEFLLGSEWQGYSVTASFAAGDTEISVVLNPENKCLVPWEVLELSGQNLTVGIVGVKGESVYPSDYAVVGVIGQGCKSAAFGTQPTADIYSQIAELSGQAASKANAVWQAYQSGELKGEKGDKGDKGENGADGTVSFADLTPQQQASLKGEKGDKGDSYTLTQADKQEMVNEVLSLIPNGDEVSY